MHREKTDTVNSSDAEKSFARQPWEKGKYKAKISTLWVLNRALKSENGERL